MSVSRPAVRFALVLLLLSLLGLLGAAVTHGADGETWGATRTRGGLMLTAPYHADRAGAGHLVMEILDPDDNVLGTSERDTDVSAGDGVWHQEITLAKALPFDEMVWERVRYRFTYKSNEAPPIEETRAVSEVLRRPVVRILGQTVYLAGGEAAIRLIVTDASGHEIAGSNSIRVELIENAHASRTLFTGKLNRHGTTEAQFHFPAGITGNVQLRFVADTPLGITESTQQVRLEDKVSILLTTEKPIYQPGQTIHVRALALNRADHQASTGKLTFEVEDSHGNKVFKKATETDAFGIASAEFALADEVNLGTYHLRALLGDPQAPSNTSEIAVNVQRYVLPKFKVAIDFTPKDGKPRRDYRPGEHVTGIVHANYFFGKPVEGGEIALKATGMDVALNDAGSANGKTGADGTYRFDIRLPSYFAGRPLQGGAAPVVVEATVKDTSGHAETRGEPITVSASSLLVTAIPEGGALIPRLENQVYVLASYADGTPAASTVITAKLGAFNQQATTDASGVAVIRLTPGAGRDPLRIEASDRHGNHAESSMQLETRDGNDQMLLRAGRAVYKAGDRMELDVYSTQQRGTAYVDIVKDGQTIMTRDVDIVNGHAQLAVNATADMAGTLSVNAYRFGRDAQAIGDHRLLFVQPADELRIEATADAQSYKPGAEARIRFRVTDSHGQGIHAALGLQIVDEAVFALAEKQPGFAKVFFYLEQEVMKPRYEIHSLSMDDVIGGEERDRDLDARALFSAAGTVSANKLDTEFGRELPQARFAEYQQRYYSKFRDQVSELAAKLNAELVKHPEDHNLTTRFAGLRNADGSEIFDAWGMPLRISNTNYWRRTNTSMYFTITSAGPDRKFDTGDDLQQMIEARTGTLYPNQSSRPFTVKVEHDRGPNNGLASAAGTITDTSGAVVPRVQVVLRATTDGKRRTAITDMNGNFALDGLPAGSYTIEVTAGAFMGATARTTLQARDRAVVNVALHVGVVTEAVVVAAVEALPINNRAGMVFKDWNGAVDAVDMRRMAPPPKAAPMPMVMGAALSQAQAEKPAAPEVHVRSYFPEALYINPEILTDGSGNASITVPIADSITTWRMAMIASTRGGTLGTGTSSLKVFQDFFADLDLPVTLTQGDRVSIPVAVYNYAGERGDVKLDLKPEDWFSLVEDNHEKTVSVDAGQVGGSQYTLEARHIGKFKLTLSAHMRGKAERQDIVVREIEVVPNGREQNAVFNGRLDTPSLTSVKQTVQFPADAIPQASKVFVRLYPGPLSQVIEGMDSLLRMPYGCFEQTSSSTYPNVLALDYMKRTKKLTPEVHAKAEGFIANGYQRLLTFEVPGGGFSWFGSAPANKILTAYGLMEFSAMSKVHDVDPNLIARTRNWLASQQQPDGSWKPDTSFINEGATNRYNSDLIRITAYIAWALENTGYEGPAVEKAKRYLESHASSKVDSYTLAVVANFAVDYAKDRDFARDAVQRLLDARVDKDEQTWWTSEETGVYATGTSAAVETTGLAVQALLKWGQSAGVARKALTYLASKKDASGTWGTTQATIMALQALLLAAQIGSADVRGTVQVLLNGKTVETLTLTPENNDLFHQFLLPGTTDTGGNEVELRFEGSGGLAYQIAGRYFLPWDTKPREEDALSINVAYDRTRLEQNDIVTATATVRNNLPKTANMVMVDLGIPPGFELLSEDLQEFQEKTAKLKTGKLEKFSQTATLAILYFNAFAPHSTTELHFRLRAKFPIRARTFQSRVYEYYDPSVSAIAKPIQLEVAGRK